MNDHGRLASSEDVLIDSILLVEVIEFTKLPFRRLGCVRQGGPDEQRNLGCLRRIDDVAPLQLLAVPTKGDSYAENRACAFKCFDQTGPVDQVGRDDLDTWLSSAFAAGAVGLRMMPRMAYAPCLSRAETTDSPCVPVAPRTTTSLFAMLLDVHS